MTILNTQSSKRGATHLRAEPAAAHALHSSMYINKGGKFSLQFSSVYIV
nr:MAG TPA: hypothetical protein [Caudoviricetes sp.]